MLKPRTPALKIGTPVAVNIAQGLAITRGVVAASHYDDGWLYRIDVTAGDDCREHRNELGELWVCDTEIESIP